MLADGLAAFFSGEVMGLSMAAGFLLALGSPFSTIRGRKITRRHVYHGNPLGHTMHGGIFCAASRETSETN